MDPTPPPPPPSNPVRVGCGELRTQHVGRLVELDGRVNRCRLGRFIELKDSHGSVQLVAPSSVNIIRFLLFFFLLKNAILHRIQVYQRNLEIWK